MGAVTQVQAMCWRCDKEAIVSTQAMGRHFGEDVSVNLLFTDDEVLCDVCRDEIARLNLAKKMSSGKRAESYQRGRIELLDRQIEVSTRLIDPRLCTVTSDLFAAEASQMRSYQLRTWSLGDGFAMLNGYESLRVQRQEERL